MFALCQISRKAGHESYLGLSGLYFSARIKGRQLKIPLNELVQVSLEKRRKLASMLVYIASLEVFAIAGAGLLLTYYGMQEYPVLRLEHGNQPTVIWLPGSMTIAAVVMGNNRILFTFAPLQNTGYQSIAVNPELLDSPVIIAPEGKVIGYSRHLINHDAVLPSNSLSFI